ncbi:hypothetical protein Vafri_19129, partial [Volvox africanus]
MMELPRFASCQITPRKPLSKQGFPFVIKKLCLIPGRTNFHGVMPVNYPGGRSIGSSGSVGVRGSGSSSGSQSKVRSGKSSSKGSGRNGNPGKYGKYGVVELPEVLYRFTDSSGNSATVIDKDGTVSRISIVEPLPIVVGNPLASFDERDIDPASSEPVVPTSILAPLPLLLPITAPSPP